MLQTVGVANTQMDKIQLNEWLQTAAAIGVILSLAFADVYQQRTAIAIQLEQDFFARSGHYL